MKIFELFPTTVLVEQLVISKEEYEVISNIETTRNELNNCHLSDNVSILEIQYLDSFKSKILKYINKYFYEILGITTNIIPVITNSWKIVHNKNDWAPIHRHTNCIVSGIYYLNVDKNSGNLVFYSGNKQSVQNNGVLDIPFNINNYNYTSWQIQPVNNMLILFPSFLEHSVKPSASEITRISIAFDVFVKGELGNTPLNKFLLK